MSVDEIAGKDLIAIPIEQHDRLGGMPWHFEDLDCPTAKFEHLTIRDETCDLERLPIHPVRL